MKTWLSRARRFRGVTAERLAREIGISSNYIQQIEGGRRHPSPAVSEKITQYLGFGQSDISFNSKPLLNKLADIEAVSGENAFCFCKLYSVGCKSYIVDVLAVNNTNDLSNPPDQCEPIRIKYARSSIHSQMVFYEDHAEGGLERIDATCMS